MDITLLCTLSTELLLIISCLETDILQEPYCVAIVYTTPENNIYQSFRVTYFRDWQWPYP